MYLDSYEKYYEGPHFFLVNKPSGLKCEILYDDNLKYSTRTLSALKQIQTDYVILSFEDMILTDYVDIDKLEDICEFLDRHEISFVRLLKSGISPKSSKVRVHHLPLYNLGIYDFAFSITPTVWDKEWLISILEDNQELTVWDLENAVSGKLKDFHGLYWYNGERANII
jgi:hypothetical protein